MKLWKLGILVVSIMSLAAMAALPVSAESDPTGDVYHRTITGASYSWELYGERENVDITDISYDVVGSDVTLSLTVKGRITDSQNILYYIHLKKDDSAFYQIFYTNGSGMVSGGGVFQGFYDYAPEFTLSTDGKTISYTFTDLNTTIDYEPWGWAQEYLEYTVQGGEAWFDYAPNAYAPWYTAGDETDPDDDPDNGGSNTLPNGDGTTPTGTPGFELIALLIAATILLIAYKRRR